MTQHVCTRRLHTLDDEHIQQLAEVLFDCVEGSASVGFMHPFTRAHADRFFRGLAPDVASGARALVVAEDAAGICGTVQVILHQPDNQPHRGDLCKMLVHRRARSRGVGAALLQAAEDVALGAGKTLLVLDTANLVAERLYERQGWIRVGTIPNYALWPQGGHCDTTIYYRNLS